MNEIERAINLISEGEIDYSGIYDCELNERVTEVILNALREKAERESGCGAKMDAERDGRLVVLPCKVGTRVWVIGQNCDLCRDMYAEEPCLFGSCEYKEVFESVFGYGMIDNFGKTVFLTRAEAEAALKGERHEAD
jgi:hypothetical protein